MNILVVDRKASLLVEKKDDRQEDFDKAVRSRGLRMPMSTNRPPLRYSARPVSPSISVTVMPARSSGSIKE